MNYIVFDLEWNQSPGGKKYSNSRLPFEIIEIGAVKLNEKFDVIYIDPPYFSGIYEKSLNAIKNIVGGIIILEHVTDVDLTGYEVIKQKKYGDKFITFLRKVE